MPKKLNAKADGAFRGCEKTDQFISTLSSRITFISLQDVSTVVFAGLLEEGGQEVLYCAELHFPEEVGTLSPTLTPTLTHRQPNVLRLEV